MCRYGHGLCTTNSTPFFTFAFHLRQALDKIVGSTRTERSKAREHLPSYQKLSGALRSAMHCWKFALRWTLFLLLFSVCKGCDIVDAGQAVQYQVAVTSSISPAKLSESIKPPTPTTILEASKVLPTAVAPDVSGAAPTEGVAQQQKPPLKRL